ncbi:AI-2E family transporter [uncultured Clostridium sp.]|jgi:predicted PurR-regulated permease PerM|uniref:AI-2E family transporter n=1 Tax=uncultured Clostridium sp. TaxID=59620 RepID=UPI002637C49F|nr:AI-2E family transporter [uncultured Clostridium sp.]
MKLFNNDNSKYFKIFAVVILSYVVIKLIDNYASLFNGINTIYNLLFPFVVAFVIAYILNPVVKLFNKKFKLSHGLSIALTYILFVGILAIGAFFLFPKLYISIIDLVDAIPTLTTEFQDKLTVILSNVENQAHLSQLNAFDFDVNTIIEKFSTVFTSMFNGILNTAILLTTSIVNIVFGFLISIYVLTDKDNFLAFGKRITLTTLGKKNGTRTITFISILNKKVGTYISIKAFDSLIIGVIAFIGLYIMNSKYLLLLAVIVGITNMIPYFGPFIGMIVAFFVNLFAADFKLGLMSLIFLFILQQFDAWYLDPKLIGNKVGLSPYLVILAVTIGAFVYGPIGMILASPVASVIKIYTTKLLDRYDYRRTGHKKEEIEVEEIEV